MSKSVITKLKKIKGLKVARNFVKTWSKPKNFGYCPVCHSKTIFVEKHPWLREHYSCIICGSTPRQSGLVMALNQYYPNWRNMMMHESSPGTMAASWFIEKESKNYSASHFFPEVKLGEFKDGFRCENLSRMTFDDESFELFITQDVFEHVMEPMEAFSEIGRVLKPGGAHIFTLGWSPKNGESKPRSIIKNGEVVHLKPPEYHGNPIDEKGSLVTWDWGPDIVHHIYKQSGMITTICNTKNRKLGLDGETIEVFISQKIRI